MNYGYYIHRSAIGYLTSGLSYAGQPGAPMNPGAIEGQVQQYIQQKFGNKLNSNLAARRSKVSEIEKKYQEMLFDPADSQSSTGQIREALRQALEVRLKDAFGDAAGKVSIENLAAIVAQGGDSAPYMKELKDSMSNSLKQIANKEKITEGKLKQITQEIQRRVDTIAKNHESLESLRADFEKNKVDFNQFRKDIETLASGLEAGAKNFITFPASETVTLESLKAMIDLIGDSKTLLAANQAGAIGEWLVPMINYSLFSNLKEAFKDAEGKITEELIKEIADTMMSFNLGGTTVDMVINAKGQVIRDGAARKKEEQGIILTAEEASMGCKVIHRTNKTDAFLYWNESEGSREDISVKNYSSLNGITLVSNTPLNFIIDQLGVSAGHVKNILVVHTDDNLIMSYRQAVNAQIMKLILCFSLVGYSDQNRPSIFMVISNKKVYCFDMDSILAELISASIDGTGNYAIAYNGAVSGAVGAAISFNAGWNLNSSVSQPLDLSTSAEKRISTAIENFEAQKIHSTLSIHLSI